MKRIDEQYLETPFYGSRKMAVELGINRKHAQRLMRRMGLEAAGVKRRTTQPAPGHKIYPYLLRNLAITRPNQVWATDITYIPLRQGFLYLVAVMDWFSCSTLRGKAANSYLLVVEGGNQGADAGHIEDLADFPRIMDDLPGALIAHEMGITAHELAEAGAVDFSDAREVDDDPGVALLQHFAPQILKFVGRMGELSTGAEAKYGNAPGLLPGQVGRTQIGRKPFADS